jgi:hypothetical protein
MFLLGIGKVHIIATFPSPPSNIVSVTALGYNAPQNLQNYAIYLDSRIRAYRDLKHDAVRVQSESNRDLRNTNSIEEDMAYRGERGTAKGPQRSKTVMGRKLRVMTVEKGLLRETKAVQRMIDSLVECRVCYLCLILDLCHIFNAVPLVVLFG